MVKSGGSWLVRPPVSAATGLRFRGRVKGGQPVFTVWNGSDRSYLLRMVELSKEVYPQNATDLVEGEVPRVPIRKEPVRVDVVLDPNTGRALNLDEYELTIELLP